MQQPKQKMSAIEILASQLAGALAINAKQAERLAELEEALASMTSKEDALIQTPRVNGQDEIKIASP